MPTDSLGKAVLQISVGKDTWTADTAKLKQDAAGLGAQFENVGKQITASLAGLEAYASKLSGNKLFQSATDWAAAVGKLGGATEGLASAEQILAGASKLTAAEREKINKLVTEAIDKYKALGQAAPAAVLQLADATKRLGDHTLTWADRLKAALPTQSSMLASVQATALGYLTGTAALQGFEAAGSAVIGFLTSSVKAFGASEDAQRRLQTALRAQGNEAPGTAAALGQLANAYEQITVHSDEALKESEALLIQVGNVLPRQMDKALEATTNLASGLGIDLREATLLVSKAFEDNFTALKKAGVQIDESRASAEGMDYVLGQINARFGGQARSEAESYAGSIKRAANAWDDFKEGVGQVIVQSGPFQIVLGAINKLLAEQAQSAKQAEEAYNRYLAAAMMRGVNMAGKNFGQDVGLPAEIVNVKNYVLELENAKKKIAALSDEKKAGLAAGIALGEQESALGKTYHLTAGEINVFKAALEASKQAAHTAAEELKKHNEEVEKFRSIVLQGANTSLAAFLGKLGEVTLAMPAHLVALKAVNLEYKALPDELAQAASAMSHLPMAAGEIATELIKQKAATEDDRAAIERIVTSMRALQKEFDDAIAPLSKFLATLTPVKLKLDAVTAATMYAGEAQKVLNPETVKAVAIMREHGATVEETTAWLQKYAGMTNEDAEAVKAQARETVTLDSALRDLSQSFALLSQIGGSSFGGITKQLGTMIAGLETAAKTVKALLDLMSKMGGVNADGSQKFAGLAGKKVAGYADTAIVGAATGAEIATLTGTRSQGKGALEGAAGGAVSGAVYGTYVAPGVGTVAGAIVGGIAGAIGGWMAARKAAAELRQANVDATKAIGDMEKQLATQYGGLAGIDTLGKQVGIDLRGAWGDQSIAGLAHFQGLVDEFQKRVKALDDAVQEFGLTWKDLTKDAQLRSLSDSADALATKMDVLQTAGYDMAAVAEKSASALLDLMTSAEDMGATLPDSLDPAIARLGQMATISDTNAAALNTYIAHAIATGTQIPPAMQPVIDKLIDMGKLTDDNARALLGLAAVSLPNWHAMADAATRYGISIDALGPKFQQSKLNEGVQQLADDFKELIDNGADLGEVLKGMAPKAQSFLDDALKWGLEIPASMKPILEQMAAAGLLTDENGEKLTDLSKIKFGEDLAASGDKAKEKLEELGKGFSKDLPAAAADGVQHIQEALDSLHMPTLTLDLSVTGQPVYPMASGFMGRVTRPTLFLAGEKPGGEDVMFSGAGQRFADKLGPQAPPPPPAPIVNVTNNITLQGQFLDAEGLDRAGPRLANQVIEEIRTSGVAKAKAMDALGLS